MIKYEISDSFLNDNIQAVLRRAKVPVWAVIKFDGYGVGILHIAELLRAQGISRFAVSDVCDLKKLRTAGYMQEDILLLVQPGSDDELRAAIKNRAILSVGSLEYATRLKSIAQQLGMGAKGHITVDTGMGRFGFLPGDYDKLRSLYTDKSGLEITGIYSHFYNASRSAATQRQYDIFTKILRRLERDGIDRGMAHISNSSALFHHGNMQLDAVRAGSAIVGRIWPPSESLKKVGFLMADVNEVKHLPKGHQVGYGSKCALGHDASIAIVCAGRWSGAPTVGLKGTLLRRFPNVEINGKTAALACPPGAGHCIIDVTGLDVKPGDFARLDVSPIRIDSGVRREYV